MGKLDNKVAVITGGTEGIGFAAAKLFLQEGAHNVVITGRDEKKLARAQKELGDRALALRSDAGKMADVSQLINVG